MYKYLIFIVSLFSLLIISGCTKKYDLNYDFDNYSFAMKSVENFDTEKVSSVEEKIIAKQTSKTGYTDSLLISSVDLSQITLDKFITLNKSTFASRFADYKEKKDKDVTFLCKGNKIKGKLLSFYVQMQDERIYFSQYVFVQNKSGYLMSISSEKSNQTKSFEDYVKKITCK